MVLLASIAIDQLISNLITVGTIIAVFTGAVASTARRIKTGDAPSEPPTPHHHDSHGWEILASERHEDNEILRLRIEQLKHDNKLMRKYIPSDILEAIGLGHDDSSNLDAIQDDDAPKPNG